MIVGLAVEMVTRLGEGKGLENFVTTHHACICSYNFLSPMRVFGPRQPIPPKVGRKEFSSL